MAKGETTVYICADGTLTYGPFGGTDKVVPQAMPIVTVADADEAENLITTMGRKAYDVPEADPHFIEQRKGKPIAPGYGPDHRYYYSFPEFVVNDPSTIPAVSERATQVRDMFRNAR